MRSQFVAAIAAATVAAASCSAPPSDSVAADASLDVSTPDQVDANDAVATDTHPDAEVPDTADDVVNRPKEIASRQSVTFRVRNVGTQATHVMIAGGAQCTAFGIDRQVELAWGGQGWERVSLATMMSSPHLPECYSGYDGPNARVWRPMDPGDQVDLVWDARELVFGEETFTCSGIGAPVPYSASQPVDSGAYRVTIAFDAAPPGTCVPCSPADVYCAVDDPYGWADMVDLVPCQASSMVEAGFTLPGDGDLVVDVDTP